MKEFEKYEAEQLEIALFRERCKRSYYFFFQEFWDVVNKEPLVEAKHLKVLCSEAEQVVRRIVAREPKKYDLLVNVPPGTSKSNTFSILLEPWSWILDPTLQIITASHSNSLSLSLATKSRDILQSDKFKKYFPEIALRKDLNAKGWFTNTAGGYRYSCTPGISPTGRHAHLIIVDDPVDPERVCSSAERDAVNNWFKSTLPTRVVDKEISAMILVMQRLNENDPCGFLLAEDENAGKLRHICLPGELSENVKPEEYKSIYTDGLLDPVRLSKDVLDTLKIKLGIYNYAGQIEQTPVPMTGGLFLAEKIQIVKTLPERIVRVFRSWDKAGTDGGGCYSAGVKIAELANGTYIVLDSISGQWRAEKREEIILQTAELDGKSVKIVIEQEPGSGGKESAEATVKNLRGFSVYVDRPSGDKALRAEPFATQVNIGNVYLLEGAWNKTYIDELKMFPRGKYKDQVDASSQGFAQLAGKGKLDYKKLMSSAASNYIRNNTPKSINGIIIPK